MSRGDAAGPVRVFIAGARPKTLGAAVVPVAVGFAASARPLYGRGALALIVALGFQIGVNYANDYFDGTRGVDTPDRAGPTRLVASGLASARSVAMAAGIAFTVALSAGLALAILVDLRLLILGAAALAAAVAYSGGPKPYAGLGLGELFVFAFFGPVAVAGTAYVQGRWTYRFGDGSSVQSVGVSGGVWLCGIAVGLLAVAILLANNIRDIPTDRAAGKMTLPVRIGDARARMLYRVCLLAPMIVIVAAVVNGSLPSWTLLSLGALPFASRPLRRIRDARGPEMIRVLVGTAMTQIVFGGLLVIGLVIAHTIGSVMLVAGPAVIAGTIGSVLLRIARTIGLVLLVTARTIGLGQA